MAGILQRIHAVSRLSAFFKAVGLPPFALVQDTEVVKHHSAR